ncbi:MAG: FimV/HubP family polar landmark protein [Methylophilaceae bacterium]
MLTRYKYFLVLLFLIPASVSGGGLGRIKVKSALGEPLSAEIELLESPSEAVSSLMAHIGSAEDYAATGLPDSYIPSDVHIQVVRRVDNSRVLQISSDRPVNEPFLELLIKAESPTVNVLRQYTILLDPPVSRFADDETKVSAEGKPKASARNRAMVDVPVPEYVPRKSRKSQRNTAKKLLDSSSAVHAPPNPSSQPALSADSYITQSGDVFGKVAQRYQPDGVSLKRVMAAFYAANPDAFVNGDMNQLIVGQTLRIPTPEAMSGKASAPKELASPAQVKNEDQNIATPKSESSPRFVLKISPGDADSAGHAHTDNPSASSDLNAPANAQAPVAAETAPVAPATPAAEMLPATTAPIVQPEGKKPLLVQGTVDNKSFFADLVANLQWIALGMVIPLLLMLAVFIFNMRRVAIKRKLQDSIFEEDHAFAYPLRQNHYSPADSLGEAGVYEATVIATETAPQGADSELYSAAGYGAFSTPGSEMDINEVDPLVEAEIYMSYGRYEQAENILIYALNKNPHKHELSLGLLKIYAERGEKDSFERVARKVYEAATLGSIEDMEIWGKAATLGLKLDPENSLYRVEHIAQAHEPALDEPLQPVAPSAVTPTPEPLASLEPLHPLSEQDLSSQSPPRDEERNAKAFAADDARLDKPLEPLMQLEQVLHHVQPGDKSNVLEFTLADNSKPAAENNPHTTQTDESLGLGELFPSPSEK